MNQTWTQLKSLASLFLYSKAYIEIGVKQLVPKKKKGKKTTTKN